MANTTLQIRHSTVAGNTPSSLANGEIAINSRDGVLYYSTPSGAVTSLSASSGPAGLNKEIQFNDSGSLGGNNKLTFDKTTGELVVNGTVRANIFSDDGVDLYDFSNRAFNTANAAFLAANTGGAGTDTYARNTANAAFLQANTPSGVANSASIYANGAFAAANTADSKAVSAGNYANAAFAAANSGGSGTDTYARNTANSGFLKANAAFNHANAAFAAANNVATVTPAVFETTADGATSTYSIGYNPISQQAVMVTIDGIVQPVSSYTVNTSVNTITFSENPGNGELIRVASFYSNANATYFQSLPANVTPSIFEATSNGAVSSFDLGFNPGSAASVLVSVGGVVQPTSAYTVNTVTNSITFTDDAPASGEIIRVVSYYSGTNAYVISDGSVGFIKLDSNVSSTIINSYITANYAFNGANSASDIAGNAFLKANLAYTSATTNAYDLFSRNNGNAAFTLANSFIGVHLSQNNRIEYAENQANAAFEFANSQIGIDTTQNNSVTAAFIQANAAWNTGNAAFFKANSQALIGVTQNNQIFFAGNQANAAFIRANNSLDANNGGTVSGNLTLSQDLVVSGNLTVLGNTFSINAGTTTSTSPLYTLALNNYTTDLVDIGFVGHYNDGTNAHSGLIRDAGTKEWHLFKGYVPQITANNNILIDDPSFTIDTLNANLHSTTVTIKNIDILPYANGIYNTANAAFNAANNATDTFVRNQANSAFGTANAAFIQANAAFAAANSGAGQAGAFNQANSAFIQANAAFNKANSLIGFTRTTVATTTASLAANASANAVVTMSKGYVLYKIAVSTGAWVTLYSNTSLANADYSRSITTDPNPGSGVIAESITTGTAANVSYYTPAVYGMNDDASVNSNGYLKIYNNSNTTNTITVTLTYLPLEV